MEIPIARIIKKMLDLNAFLKHQLTQNYLPKTNLWSCCLSHWCNDQATCHCPSVTSRVG